MRTVVGRMIGISGAMALSILAWGTSLSLDGILMIKGMSMSGARVIIIKRDAEPQVLTNGLEHFTLRLDLHSDCLISFEREGCVSKQLLFNTDLPKDYPEGEGFYFPFQVTLEPMPKGERFEYAGPVGYIHFDKYINAFGYDTDYRLAKNDVLAKRLETVRSELQQQALATMAPVPASGTLAEASGNSAPVIAPAPTHYEVLAPTVSRTAPMVHLLDTPEKVDEQASTSTVPLNAAVEKIRSSASEPELLALSPQPLLNGTRNLVAMPSYRWTDVQADRLHVITIIKVQEEEREVEYRRVFSYYGGTTYFRDGLPCSGMIYEQGIAH